MERCAGVIRPGTAFSADGAKLRRLPSHFAVPVVLSFAIILACTSLPAGAQWPMQGANAQRTSRSSDPGPVSGALRWTYDLDDRLQDNASPIVGPDGTVYSTSEGAFYAINANGTLKWKRTFTPFPLTMRHAPGLSPDGRALYVVTEDRTLNHLVTALSSSNGATLWQFPFAAREVVNYSSFAVDGAGTIYIGAIDTSVNASGRMYAIRNDGTLKWRYVSPAVSGIEAPPAVDPNGNVYFVQDSVGVVALDGNGQFKWTKAVYGDYGWPTPAIGADGTIFIAGEVYNNLVAPINAFNPDGSVKWTRSDIEGAGFFAGVALSADGSTLYTARQRGKVYALSAATGATVWASTIAGTKESFGGSPALSSNGILYVMSDNDTVGRIYAVSAADGRLLWQQDVQNHFFYWGPQSPALGPDGTLYVMSPGEPRGRARLYAFRNAACSFAISPSSAGFGISGGTGSVTVIASNANCTWTVSSNAGWITVASGAGGTGNGIVDYTVAASAGPQRTGTITIGGRTFAVNQGIAPTITTQPANLNAATFGNVSFTVAATGAAPLAYQWQVSTDAGTSWADLADGFVGFTRYSGTTSSTLAASIVTRAAQYRCVVSNDFGSATSNAAVLTYPGAPVITTQPTSQTVASGQTVSFAVAATGSPSFQWQVATGAGSWTNLTNSAPYAGATTSTLTLTNVGAGLNGAQYRCVATNSAGSVGSNAAMVTVTGRSSARDELPSLPPFVASRGAKSSEKTGRFLNTQSDARIAGEVLAHRFVRQRPPMGDTLVISTRCLLAVAVAISC